MARKVVVTLIDDYDGTSVAEETVTFEIDGVAYEIDLSATNATKLREIFDQWLPYTRRTGRAKTSKRRSDVSSGNSTPRSNLIAIRAWANENGYTVSSRGRISAEVIAAYERASA